MVKARRLGSALAAAAFAVVVVVAVPSTANAASAPPPGVDEILDIPSRALKSVSGSPLGDTTLVEMWRAMTRASKGGTLVGANGPGGTLVTAEKAGRALATIPKPITAPAALTRLGGEVLAAPMIGWALASNGTLALTSLVNGTDFESTFCAQPGWYQGVTSFVNLGFAPDCGALFPEPNIDQGVTYTAATYGGATASVDGYSMSRGGVEYVCGHASGDSSLYYGGTISARGLGTFGLDASPTAPAQVYRCSDPKFPGSNWNGLAFDFQGVAIYRKGTNEQVARSEAVRADPERTARCRIEWEDGTTTLGTGDTYQESGGLPLSASGLGCEQAFVSKPGAGPDLLPSRIGVDSEDDAGAITTISDQNVPDFSPTEREALKPGNGHGLVLEKTVGTKFESCMTWAADCASWWTATEQGTVPGVYRCTYGGVVIDLVECGPYRTTFDTRTDTPTITDPVTGTETPWSAKPSVGNSTDPGVGLDPSGQCFADGWSDVQNPVDWILLPVKCALVWAFVPRPSVVTQVQTTVAEAWAPTIVGRLPPLVSAAVAIPDGGTGCTGPHVVIPIKLGGLDTGYDGYPLSACDAPFDVLAGWSRIIGSAVLIWMTGLGIIRRASSTVNAPGVGGGGG